jgi:hypothetical protein
MLIGYKCKVCGAPVDPETGYCKYCDTLNPKPSKSNYPLNESPRIYIHEGDNKKEIKPIRLNVGLDSIQTSIVTEDGCKEFNTLQYVTLSITAPLQDDVFSILSLKTFQVTCTGFFSGYAHMFTGYIKGWYCHSTDVDINYNLDIASLNPVDFWNTRKIYLPPIYPMKCPVCGAMLNPEKKNCDYCGYWWIYSPEGKLYEIERGK